MRNKVQTKYAWGTIPHYTIPCSQQPTATATATATATPQCKLRAPACHETLEPPPTPTYTGVTAPTKKHTLAKKKMVFPS